VLLLDNSAWARRRHSAVRERLARAMESGELAVCLPFLLEAGYSARSEADHRAIARRLALLARIGLSPEVEALSLDAQRQLSAVGHHRLPPSDIVIAACAHHAGTGVLHYDRDYDLIAQHTELSCRGEWLAPAGTL
jgi:predicted nucleic acid-binding protein